MSGLLGRTLKNQFRVDAFVASGGMGAVYRVWDLKRNVPLAMKVLHADLADDPSIFKRFQREANALKKLAHPNIVPFYGLYQTQDFAFLLERFVDGPSLKEILRERQGRPLAVEEALAYLKALSAALGYAHANGVVHCDVKPGNVMVDRGGNIYLTDFGVARHAESTTTTLGAAGTPAYMAPEQIRGEAVSPATDVYALGVMLFEMLTGQRPFRGTEAGTETAGNTINERIRYGHLWLAPPHPSSLNSRISPDLAQVVVKALQKDPAHRFANVQDLLLTLFASAGVNYNSLEAPVISGKEQGVEERESGRRSSGKLFVLAFGGVITFLLLVYAIINSPPPPPPTDTSQSVGISENSRGDLISGSVAADLPDPTKTEPSPNSATPGVTESSDNEAILRITSEPTYTSFPTPQPPTNTPASLSETPTTPPLLVYVLGPIDEADNADVYISSSQGDRSKPVADSRCHESEPALSSNGEMVVYQRKCSGESVDLWVGSASGGGSFPLVNNPDYDEREPDWAPDGRSVVYRRSPAGSNRDSNGDIRIVYIDGSNDHSLDIEGRGPTWSPDNRYLAYMKYEATHWQIFLFDFNTSNPRPLTNCSEFNCRWPAWSPDSKFIVYNKGVGPSSSPGGLWIVSIEGEEPESLLDKIGAGRPSWSDSGWIVFGTDKGIEIINVDERIPRILIRDPRAWAPAWSR